MTVAIAKNENGKTLGEIIETMENALVDMGTIRCDALGGYEGSMNFTRGVQAKIDILKKDYARWQSAQLIEADAAKAGKWVITMAMPGRAGARTSSRATLEDAQRRVALDFPSVTFEEKVEKAGDAPHYVGKIKSGRLVASIAKVN